MSKIATLESISSSHTKANAHKVRAMQDVHKILLYSGQISNLIAMLGLFFFQFHVFTAVYDVEDLQ